jgi:hypothetical protein
MHGYTEGSRVKLSTGDISIKSAGVFEAKQRAFQVKESPKLLDMEYSTGILLHIVQIVQIGRAGVEPARTLLSSGF